MRTSNQNEIDQLLSKDVSCSPSNPEKGNLGKDVASAEGQTPKPSHCFIAHTPGPWTICEYAHYDKHIPINDGAILVDHDDVDHAQARADACLITAAPDMLAALKMTDAKLTKLAADLDGFVMARDIRLIAGWQEQIRAVVSKAESQS